MPVSLLFQIAMVLCLAAGTLAAAPALLDVASALAVATVLLQWRGLGALPRLFAALAAAGALAVALVFPARLGEIQTALRQGIAFAALLSVLGLLRHPVRRSPRMRQAALCLVRFPARRRYAAVKLGSHFLSLLFNVGIIPLLGDLLSRDEPETRDEAQRRRLLLAGMRGTVLMTLWSPMGVGFAIVTGAIAGLDPMRFAALAFATAMLLLLATCLLLGPAEADAGGSEAGQDGLLPRPMRPILLVTLALLALTVGLHGVLSLSFVMATILVLPAFALLWLRAEPGAAPLPFGQDLKCLLQGMNDMRTEAAIYLSASVIGAAIAVAIRETGLWQALQAGAAPGLPALFACLLAIPLAGAAFLPHSVLVVLLAQLLGGSALGLDHPMALGMTLMLTWAIAISLSPISAMSLMTGALTRTPSPVVSLRWNLGFALTLMALSMALVSALYGLGC
ncbi:hypothetical protein GCM10011390_45670 [Aureimonas endophytica]|uniref:H+/citrate symporter n=1 Tax=Aureimonas endophytica TaxID=2027858 RepID=A0A917EC16_9HYPH|nr:hypothetical protein [Aureimonas endophytica]GGE21232.1 hypothetical protein GCM10011390_45670 [Aureimonas endophytica]